MSSHDSFNDYYIFIYTVLAGFLIACLLLIKCLIGKRRGKGKLSSESKNTPKESKTSLTNLLPKSFYEKPHFLQKVAERISVDRQNLVKSVFEEHSAIQERTLEQLLSKQSCSQKALYEVIEEKSPARDGRMDAILENLVALKSDFLTLQNQLKYVMPHLPKSFRKFLKKPLPSNELTVSTQAEGGLVEGFAQPEEILDVELVNCIVVATKECFVKLATETRKDGREVIQKISRFLDQSQREIQKEITIFCSVVNDNDRDERGITTSVVDEVDNVEKNLHKTSIFLNRQRFEMETFYKTLKYFNNRFLCIGAKFNTYWQTSTATYENAAQRLEETEGHWSSTAKKIDKSSRCLLQQSKTLWNILSDMQTVLKYYKNSANVPLNLENLEENPISDNAEVPWAKRLIEFSQKLEELSIVTENIKGKLQLVAQSSTKLEAMHDLIKNIAKGYGSLMNFLLFNDPKYDSHKSPENKDSDHFIEQCENIDSYLRMLKNDDNTARKSNSGDVRFEMKSINCTKINTLWNEAYREVNTESQNIDLNKITGILKYIAQTAWELADCDRHMTDEHEYDSVQITDPADNNKVIADWQEIPSEVLLTDITSGYLVQNSEDSE